MAREIRVHKGTIGEGTPQERPAAWVETALKLDPEAHQLADALGSHFLRYDTTEDDERIDDRPQSLPDFLKQSDIMKIYRDEMRRYGEEFVSVWGDEMGFRRHEYCRKWLMEIVLDAFPEMKGYEVK